MTAGGGCEVNPLRVLDDKAARSRAGRRRADAASTTCATRAATTSTPSCGSSTGSACATRSTTAIVRGLDYYTRTTFEFFVAGRRGQQQALGGGGRYDGLAEVLGGRPTPGIGFGLGIDRAVLAAQEMGVEAAPGSGVGRGGVSRSVSSGAAAARGRSDARAGLRVRADGSERKLGRQLEAAAKVGARWALIVGEELERGSVVLRDLDSGEQRDVSLDEVAKIVSEG